MNKSLLYALLIPLSLFHTHLLAQRPGDVSTEKYPKVKELDSLDLKTGDILFFQSNQLEGKLIRLGTLSPYTHTAMVIRDPDGSLWLTHCTDNKYDGQGIPVRYEPETRGGVILTRLEDSFLYNLDGKSGFYRKIWVHKLDESKVERPERTNILNFYNEHKHLPFETSKLHFALTALDLRLFGKDLLSIHDPEPMICSEYIYLLLQDSKIPVEKNQVPHEYTPKDINRLIKHYYHEPLLFRFKDGAYRLEKR